MSREAKLRVRVEPMRKTVPVLLAIGVSVACSSGSSPSPPPAGHVMSSGELGVRRSLGIPDGAKQVLLLAQTSHLDIDWQKTFADYYSTWVETAFLQARQVLDSQPRAFYSIAEMAYLQQHVQAHPEELAPLKADAARGALRIVGGGMTSPDTLLPEPEMLFRDLLYGVRFSEDTFGVTPRAAWLPDSFGHSGSAPDILAAAGFTSVAFSRIDGSPSLSEQLFHPGIQPLPGSTAAILQQLGSADFVWTGIGGASVLGHFIPGTGLYCEGESMDWSVTLSEPGTHLGNFEGGDASFVEGKLDGFAAQNAPYARTPYMLVPVGCDFEPPKPQLLQYAAEYDRTRYPSTGVWVAVAPFDDYETLVGYWRDALPTVTGDLAPAFMGFFGTRAAIKRGVRDAARPFFVAEAFASALGTQGPGLLAQWLPTLRTLTRTDHHDFVTGTSNDEVVDTEQMPLLSSSQLVGGILEGEVASAISGGVALTSGAVSRVVAFNASSVTRDEVAEVAVAPVGGSVPATALAGGKAVPVEVLHGGALGTSNLRLSLTQLPPWSWTVVDLLPGSPPPPSSQVSLALQDATGAPATGPAVKRVVLSNAHVQATLEDDGSGFALTSVTIDGAQAIAGRSLLPVDYADMGGLWRLGNEMGAACTLAKKSAAPGATTVTVIETSPLRVTVDFVGPTATLEASLAANQEGLDLAVITGAAEGTTRTFTFAMSAEPSDPLVTSSPVGWIARQPEHVFAPTFYPAVSWAKIGAWAVLLRQSTGVHTGAAGQLELMAVRDARQEQCDLTGGTGTDTATHRIEWRIVRAATPLDAERAAQAYDRPVDLVPVALRPTTGSPLPSQLSLASVEGGGIISAIKPAERGSAGVLVRTRLLAGRATVHLGAPLAGRKASYVDLAERDEGKSWSEGSTLSLDPASHGSIATVRLLNP